MNVPTFQDALLKLADGYRLYHRHQVIGLDRLRRSLAAGEPVLLVSNHCFEAADALMFAAAVRGEIGRIPRFIGHEILFFSLPGVRRLSRALGAIPNRRPDLAERALREDRLLMIYPGGGSEAALRLYRRERYRLKWNGRTGFLRLALRARAKIFFVAGLGIDEMFYQTDWRIPDRLFALPGLGYLSSYRGLRVQLGLAGIHLLPGVFPLPVRVTHTISEPLPLDLGIDPTDDVAVNEAHLEIWARCQAILDHEVERRPTDRLDHLVRSAELAAERIGL